MREALLFYIEAFIYIDECLILTNEALIFRNEALDIEKNELPGKNNRLTGGFCVPISKPSYGVPAFRNRSIFAPRYFIPKQKWTHKNWRYPCGLKGRWMIAQGNALGSRCPSEIPTPCKPPSTLPPAGWREVCRAWGNRASIASPGCRAAREASLHPGLSSLRPFRPHRNTSNYSRTISD